MSIKRPLIRHHRPVAVREVYAAMRARVCWLRDFHAEELGTRGLWLLALCERACRAEMAAGGETVPLSEVL